MISYVVCDCANRKKTSNAASIPFVTLDIPANAPSIWDWKGKLYKAEKKKTVRLKEGRAREREKRERDEREREERERDVQRVDLSC